jgi:glycosyltransferase involved in cell wall biosynthesis
MDRYNSKKSPVILLVGSYALSLINFRGALLDRFKSLGYEVHVAAPNLNEHADIVQALLLKDVIAHDIPLKRTGTSIFFDCITLSALIILLIKIKPTHFLSYTIKPIIYGSLAAWIARVPNRFAMITGVGYAFQQSTGKYSLLFSLVKKLYKLALSVNNKVFFQNPDDEMLFDSYGLIDNVETSQINGSGVDIDHFGVINLPENINFLMIGRLLSDKGVREYVEAAKVVNKKFPATVFKLVGWIDDNPNAITAEELQSWIASGVIKYLGRLDDVRPAIASSTVFVLPSYREGTPRTVLEAMAMGRPIITTDVPGCRETVKNNQNGYLVQVKSVKKLSLAMLKFLNNPTLCEVMGKRSRSMVVSKYDVHKVNDDILREMGLDNRRLKYE